MQVALLQTGAWGLCALAIFHYQDVSSFFFPSSWQDGLEVGGVGGFGVGASERRRPASWFTHFLQRFTVKWDKEISDRTNRRCVFKVEMII